MRNYEDDDFFDIDDIDNVTIGEIDLGALGRAYSVIRIFYSINENDGISPKLEERFRNYIFGNGANKLERELAMRMVFEQEVFLRDNTGAIEKILGFPLTEEPQPEKSRNDIFRSLGKVKEKILGCE